MAKTDWTRLIFGVIILVVVLGPLLGAVSSEEFRYCIKSGGDYPTAQSKEDKATAGLVSPRGFLTVRWRCAGGYANENGGAITGVATILLTIATGLLSYLAYLQFKTTRTQLRAFVFAPEFRATFTFDENLPANQGPAGPIIVSSWSFHPVWHNSGETQTHRMVTHVDHEFRDSLLPQGFQFRDNNQFTANIFLGPKSAATGGISRAFPVHEIREVQQGARFLYLWGWTRYRDVFPTTKPHITRYCVQVQIAQGDPSHSDVRFTYLISNEGNCSDDECVALGLG